MRRIWVLMGFLAISAAALYAGIVLRLPLRDAPFEIPWWALAIAFALTEIFVVHLQFRREAQTYGLSDIPLVIGLHFVAPPLMVLAQVTGAALGLVIHRKQSGLKLFFNLAHMALQGTVAAIIFYAIAHGTPMGPWWWLASLTAVIATNLIADLAIGTAIWLTERAPIDAWRLGLGAIVSVANTSLALTAVIVLWTRPSAGWTLLVLLGIMHAAHQAYASLRSQHERLETLYAATRSVHDSIELEKIGSTFLQELRTMFRAQTAEIVLFDPTEGSAVSTTSTGTGEVQVSEAEIRAEWANLPAAVLIDEAVMPPAFSARGFREVMIAPLAGKNGMFGTVMVADREGKIRGFNGDDLKQFETAVSHGSVSLENAQLVGELRRHVARAEYEARHDALTGLGNRSLMDERLNEAVKGRGRYAVLLLDLDRFKEVNDTLGHRNGDALLQALAGRLSVAAGPDATVARFGGDEFAVLAPCDSNIGAASLAKRLLAELDEPFELEGLSVAVEGSLGIAVSPEHGTDAQTLVQRADVAMYLAKQTKTGFEFYDAERDEYSPARLALVAELREALDRDELTLHYQPKVELRSGDVVGAEALVRWEHPRRGMLPPGEFIPLAEQTGMAGPLTMLVLGKALRAARGWRDSGRNMTVSVNLPTRMLLDLSLPDKVAAALEEAGLRPEALTLEVTESSVLEDPERSVMSLQRLRDMGVHISIDDFGTGYSSLAHLRELPAQEIKIDKSFVTGMMSDASDEAIVRTTIDLGRSLGRSVVAEGVETREVWERLTALGCDVMQGYFVSKPIPAERFAVWLAAYDAPAPPTASAHVTRLIASAG